MTDTKWMWIKGINHGNNHIALVTAPVKPCTLENLTTKTFYQELFKDFHIEGRFSKKLELILPEKVLITNVDTWNLQRSNHINDKYKDLGFWIPNLIQTEKLYLLRETLYYAYCIHHESNKDSNRTNLSQEDNRG